MFKSRRRFNYANITATLALVFSMSGGALAASHYLINSTKQINPKVLKKLKGHAGAAGTPGAPGKEGPQGKEGLQGKEGKEGLAGTARAYAEIRPAGTGTPTVSKAKNVTSASRTSAGVYCVQIDPASGINLSAERPIVDVDWNDSESFDSGLFAYDGGVNCGANGYAIYTADENKAGSLPERTDGVTFDIAVP